MSESPSIASKYEAMPSIVLISTNASFSTFTCVRKDIDFNLNHFYINIYRNRNNWDIENSEVMKELLKIERLEFVLFSFIQIDGHDALLIANFCAEHEINFGFVDSYSWYLSAVLMECRIVPKLGERIAILWVRKSVATLYILVQNYPQNWEFDDDLPKCSIKSIQNVNLNDLFQATTQILSSNPDQVILFHRETSYQHVKAAFEIIKASLSDIRVHFENPDFNFSYRLASFQLCLAKCIRFINQEAPYFSMKYDVAEIYGIVYASKILDPDLIKQSLVFLDSGRTLPLEESVMVHEVADDLVVSLRKLGFWSSTSSDTL